MKRFFNTTGLCNVEDHYMVDPFRNMYDDIHILIDDMLDSPEIAIMKGNKEAFIQIIKDNYKAKTEKYY